MGGRPGGEEVSRAANNPMLIEHDVERLTRLELQAVSNSKGRQSVLQGSGRSSVLFKSGTGGGTQTARKSHPSGRSTATRSGQDRS